jgi:hypothetical protein
MTASRNIFLRVYLQLKAIALRTLYFRNEQALLKGEFHSVSDRPSFAFFTVHKAGSSILSLRLSNIFRKNRYTVVDLSSWFAKTDPSGRERFFQNEAQKQKVFSARGVYYAVFRYPFSVPEFDAHKILLVLRDPRDVLVSHYFSTRFSHPVQNMDFAAQKEQAAKLDIDAYVLRIAPDFLQRYTHYMDWTAKPNVLFLRYEDMISAPDAFEERIRSFSALDIAPGELVSAADFVVEKEDPHSHKRYVQAGDHTRKLKPETIAELNRQFAAVLAHYGYAK